MKKEGILNFYAKYKLFVFPATVALSCLILIALVILPQTMKLLENQKTGNDLIGKSKLLEVKAQTLETLDAEDLSKKVAYALNIYPPDKDFGNMLGVIQQVAGQTGFSIASFNVGGSRESEVQNYRVSLQLIGPRPFISTLISSLENAPRLMKVDNIEISQAAGNQGVEVNLGLNILFSPLPQDFGTVDSPLPKLSQKEEELIATLAKAREQSGVVSDAGEAVSSTPKGKLNPFE